MNASPRYDQIRDQESSFARGSAPDLEYNHNQHLPPTGYHTRPGISSKSSQQRLENQPRISERSQRPAFSEERKPLYHDNQEENRRTQIQEEQRFETNFRNANRPGPNNDQKDIGYTEFFSWGADSMGQLGHGGDLMDPRPVSLPKSLSFEVYITQIACGFAHSMFISRDGHLFAFGSNSDGQLGINDSQMRHSSAPLLVADLIAIQVTPSTVACGGNHTALVGTDGSLYTWGRNAEGQCSHPTQRHFSIYRPQRVELPRRITVGQISCGDKHTAFVATDGSVFTCGDNAQGQLGSGSEFDQQRVQIKDSLRQVVEIKEDVKMVACGYQHTLVLTTQGIIYGMGSNQRCELGLGNQYPSQTQTFFLPVRLTQLESHRVLKIFAGGFSAAITEKNQLIVWGTGEFGVFTTPKKVCMTDVNFVSMTISPQENASSAAIDSKGGLYMWGPNQQGQLGVGDYQNRVLPSQVLHLKRKAIRSVALGHNFAMALGKDVTEEEVRRKKAAKEAKRHRQKSVSANNFGSEPPRAERDSARRHHSHADPHGRRPIPLADTPVEFDHRQAMGPLASAIHPHTSKNYPDSYSRQPAPLISSHSYPHDQTTAPQILSSSRAERHRSASKHSASKEHHFQGGSEYDQKTAVGSTHGRIHQSFHNQIRTTNYLEPYDKQTLSPLRSSPLPVSHQPEHSCKGDQSQRSFHRGHPTPVETNLQRQLEEKDSELRRQIDMLEELKSLLGNKESSNNQRESDLIDQVARLNSENHTIRHNQNQSTSIQQQEHSLTVRKLEEDLKHEQAERLREQESVLKREFSSQEERFNQKFHSETGTLGAKIQASEADLNKAKHALQAEAETNRELRNRLHDTEQECRTIEEQLRQKHHENQDLEDNNSRQNGTIRDLENKFQNFRDESQVKLQSADNERERLSRMIEDQGMSMRESSKRETDIDRQLKRTEDDVQDRDRRIEDLRAEIQHIRQDLDTQRGNTNIVEKSRSELMKKLEDAKFDLQSKGDQLAVKEMLHIKLDEEKTNLRCVNEQLRSQIVTKDQEISISKRDGESLRKDLEAETQRSQSRERDINSLESVLNDLKESMGREYQNKCRDLDKIKSDFILVNNKSQELAEQIQQKQSEYVHQTRELGDIQHHNQSLVDKITYLEQVISDLEQKNKRLTDMLNSQVYDKAQQYKENVLTKLLDRQQPRQRNNENADPQLMTFAPSLLSPANKNILPLKINSPSRHPSVEAVSLAADSTNKKDLKHRELSEERLRSILLEENQNQNVLNQHYNTLSQQLGGRSYGSSERCSSRDAAQAKSPLRNHHLSEAPSNSKQCGDQADQLQQRYANLRHNFQRGPTPLSSIREPAIIPQQATTPNQNQTISAAHITSELMGNELDALKSQVANLNKSKQELEGRLQDYEDRRSQQ